MSLQTKDSNPNGLHQRYIITKVDGSPIDEGAIYFNLRLDAGGDPTHVAACRKAALAYADAIESTVPELANDLRTICNEET